MHAFNAPSGVCYHHNGDWSGDVLFVTGDDEMQVEVPFADILAMAMEYLRGELVERLEQADTAELVTLLTHAAGAPAEAPSPIHSNPRRVER